MRLRKILQTGVLLAEEPALVESGPAKSAFLIMIRLLEISNHTLFLVLPCQQFGWLPDHADCGAEDECGAPA